MSESERCPMIIATIDAGSTKKKIPQMRLAIALPLFCAAPEAFG
jgi:hypothetical protein